MTYPSNGNEEAGGRSNEEDRTNPVDALQLLSQICRREIQLEKKRNKNKGNGDKWQIQPKNPSLSVVSVVQTSHGLDGISHPSDILRKSSTDHGP